MLEEDVLDLHRTHRPARGDDHVVGSPRVVEVALLVDGAAVLGVEPGVAAPDHDLADLIRRAGLAVRPLHLDLYSRHRLAEGAGLDHVIPRPRIVGEDYPHLGGTVHAAHGHVERVFHERAGGAVDGLAGEGKLADCVAIARHLSRGLHHPVVGRRRREVGHLVVLERPEQPPRVELARHGPRRHPEGERGEGAVPEPVAPRRGRRTEEAVPRPDAGAVERGDHEDDDRPVRVADGGGQLARGARGVLEDGEIVSAGAHHIVRWIGRQLGHQRVVGHAHVQAGDGAGGLHLLGIGEEQTWPAILHAEAHAVGPEEREKRHRDGAHLDGAEEGSVEG